MQQLMHPFIVTLYNAFQTAKYLYLILEYCEFGDLLELVERRGKVCEVVARFYLAQLILAIEYLHGLEILYRDLKPANVLIAHDGYLRLVDFGLAKENVSNKNPAITYAGTPAYLPPEVAAKKGATYASDIYGLGTIFYELLVGFPPYAEPDADGEPQPASQYKLKIPEFVSEAAKDLLQAMLSKNPSKRPEISQLKRHSFFRKLDWDALLAKRIKPPGLPHSTEVVE